MRIGFDLDGVIFENIEYKGNLEEYNNLLLKPLLRLDINHVIASHQVYIITGRAKDNYHVTRKTIHLLLPNFNLDNLIMVNEFDSLKIDGVFLNTFTYMNYIAIRKFRYLDSLKIDYYFDDNPLIIKVLSSAEHMSKYKVIDAKNTLMVNKILNNLGD